MLKQDQGRDHPRRQRLRARRSSRSSPTSSRRWAARSSAQEAVAKGETDMKPRPDQGRGGRPEVIYYPDLHRRGWLHLAPRSKQVPGLEKVDPDRLGRHVLADFVKAAGAGRRRAMYLSSPNFSAFQAGYAGLPDEVQGQVRQGSAPGVPRARLRRDEHPVRGDREGRRQGADGTLYIGRKALRDAIYATKDFQGITGIADLQRDGRLRRAAHRGVPDHRRARSAARGRRRSRSGRNEP